MWRHAGLRFSDLKDRCTKKGRSMRMYITGDSHGRSLYDAIRHRLEGHTDTLLDSVGFSFLSAEIDDTDGSTFIGKNWYQGHDDRPT